MKSAFPPGLSISTCIALCSAQVQAQDGAKHATHGIVVGSSELAPLSHVSDGIERARGGPARFVGPLGARGTSFDGYQYVIYYTGRDRTIPRQDAYNEVVVARRALGGFDWERSTLRGYRMVSDDAHNRPAIGVSKGDGVIHIAFDHHASPQMHYAASAAGVASDTASVNWDDNVFTYAPNLGSKSTTRLDVTYPDFKAFPGGNLLLYFRTGGSYGGDMRLAQYDSTTGEWSTPRVVSSRHGTYQGLETTRGPYLANGVQVGSDGSLQMAWVFRERPCDFTTASRSETFCNHGLYYARSNDEGRTWLRNDGTLVADTTEGEAISIDNIGGPVIDVPKGLGPSNPSITSTVDPVTSDMHVVLSHLPEPGAERAYFFHYLGQPDGTWTRTRTNFRGNDASLAIVGDRLYAFVGRDRAQIFYAVRDEQFRQWRRLPVSGQDGRELDPRGGYITWDLSRLGQDGTVSLFWHHAAVVEGTSSPLEVYDIALR